MSRVWLFQVYGYQGIKSGSSSEQLLGRFLARPSVQGGSEQLPPVVASKFFTIPWTNFLVGEYEDAHSVLWCWFRFFQFYYVVINKILKVQIF